MPPPAAEKRARRWPWILLALIVAALIAWWAQPDELPEVVAETQPQVVRTAPVEEPHAPAAPDASSAPAAIPRFEDAGALVQKPRVIFNPSPTEQQRIDETLRRWRDALAPLFRIDRSKTHKATPVIAVSDEGRESIPDAGAQAVCEDAVQKLPLHGKGSLDLVIVVDTSGSMYFELKDVVAWLTQLELALRDKGVDFQLLVVADQRVLNRGQRQRREVDAGFIQVPVGSRDALDTLITAAKEGSTPRWHQLLRAGATKHLIIVTDDEARDPRGLPYLEPLVKAAEGSLGSVAAPAFTLHLLGGFASIPEGVLTPEQPLSSNLCPDGVAAGLGYQHLAQATGGLRAPLCQPAAHKALTAALVDWPLSGGTTSCVWLARPASRVVDARALSGHSTVLRLWEARNADACIGRRDAYVSSGQVFALCATTCAILMDAGYDEIELSTRCER